MAENNEIIPKAGWTTSQGQLTAIFTLVCLILGFFGIQKTPAQLDSWVTLANSLVETALPLITALVSLIYYIISRGKIQSNTINANAQVKIAQLTPPPMPMVALTSSADGLTPLLGGDSWKDPERYENLVSLAASLGVPGAKEADAVFQKVDPSDLITGILGALHKKKK